MKFAPATLLADPLVRRAVETENRLTEDRARLAALKAQSNRDTLAASYQRAMTAADVTDNPWSASTWNLTRQSMLLKADPARAAALRAAAGLEHHDSVVSQDTARTAERQAKAEGKLAALHDYLVQLARHYVAQFHRKPAEGRAAEVVAAVAERIRQDDTVFRAVNPDGSPLHDWNGSDLVDMKPERLPAYIAETMPELFASDDKPAAPVRLAADTAGRPLHERMQAAIAAGPAAVAALKSELGLKA